MSEEFFKRYKIKANKSLGQNFLVNQDIINEIAFSLDVDGKNIIEVGPGYGALTEKLAQQPLSSLTLVELDQKMVTILNDRISLGEIGKGNLKIHIENSDILTYQAPFVQYSVIANIPYYITSPILRHFLYNSDSSPVEMIILMQKDVGEKILSSKSSVISLMMLKKSYISNILTVGKENFIPSPKVESCVLLFESHNDFDHIDDTKFLKYIKIGFSSARKKLIKNFVNGGLDKNTVLDIFTQLHISETIRGDALSIQQWCNLIDKI